MHSCTRAWDLLCNGNADVCHTDCAKYTVGRSHFVQSAVFQIAQEKSIAIKQGREEGRTEAYMEMMKKVGYEKTHLFVTGGQTLLNLHKLVIVA